MKISYPTGELRDIFNRNPVPYLYDNSQIGSGTDSGYLLTHNVSSDKIGIIMHYHLSHQIIQVGGTSLLLAHWLERDDNTDVKELQRIYSRTNALYSTERYVAQPMFYAIPESIIAVAFSQTVVGGGGQVQYNCSLYVLEVDP